MENKIILNGKLSQLQQEHTRPQHNTKNETKQHNNMEISEYSRQRFPSLIEKIEVFSSSPDDYLSRVCCILQLHAHFEEIKSFEINISVNISIMSSLLIRERSCVVVER